MKIMKKVYALIMSLALMMFMSCEELELSTTGDVVQYNNTSSTIIVDVNDGDGNWVGEKTIYSGGSTTFYNVEAGTIYGSARFSGYSTWYTSSSRYLSVDGTVTITWSPTKKNGELEPEMYAELE